MVSHIILLAVIVIGLSAAFYLFGMKRERKVLQREANNILDKDTKEHITNHIQLRNILHDTDNGAFLCLYLAVILTIAFIGSYSDIREKWINQYRNGEIVENVKYHYQKVNGEKVLKDSTFYYSKIRD